MSPLQRLRASHGPEILAFELVNRSYFAASISDRGDEFFERFDDGFSELLSVQEAGRDAYFVLVDPDGSILGTFNLVEIDNGTAELGYRVAQRVAGRGEATAAVREVSRLAVEELGIRRLRARTTLDNVASQKVLAKSGFVPIAILRSMASRPSCTSETSLLSMSSPVRVQGHQNLAPMSPGASSKALIRCPPSSA